MHAEFNVRFELSIDEDKTIPLAALAEFITEQNIESVLLKALVESLNAARVEAICGENMHTGTEIAAINEPAPIPAPPLQLPVNTS